MSRAEERHPCSICTEWATHECHVYDKAWFNTSFCPWRGRDDRDQNIILLCQTHHGVYFDKHHGREDAPGHMLIDLERNSLFTINPLIRDPSEDDIEEHRYFEPFDLKLEYVKVKNGKCHDVLKSGWFNLTVELVWD